MEIIFVLVVLGLGAAAFFHFKRKNSVSDVSDSPKHEDVKPVAEEVKVVAPVAVAPVEVAKTVAAPIKVAKKTVKKPAAKAKTAAGERAAKKPKMHVAK